VLRRKAFSKDKEAIKIFENELSNLTRLSHRHLVKFVGYVPPFLNAMDSDADGVV
jgi:hypothetical protein